MQNNLKVFAERFALLRAGVSQGEFARQLGIGQVSVSQYERGDREPSLSKLKQIAERLHVSTDWLLGLSDTCGGVSNIATARGANARAVAGENIRISTGPDMAKLHRIGKELAGLSQRLNDALDKIP